MNRVTSFLSELRRRKVVRTALLYAALGWGAVEVISTMGQVFEWSPWLVQFLVVLVFLGLPLAIAVSWAFDLTPDGLQPDVETRGSGDSSRGATDPQARAAEDPDVPRIWNPPPHPVTQLLGRERAVEDASDRLRAGARVLTITGTGGTGKTRFAIELFERLQPEYDGGAAFVSLASAEEAAEVMHAVGVALSVAEAHGRSAVEAVATVIGARRVLVVLDNLEQVLDCAADVAELVARCPQVQVIATTRAPLKIGAEVELPLPPLELPPAGATTPEDLLRYPAVDLFVQRARKVKPDFAVSGANATAIAAICRRLDGLPLALELAAARIRILDPHALLERLDHALDVLTSGDRDLPQRQRTLRATVEWSYDLLDEHERRLLRGLSAFAEGWTYGAMEAVCYDAGSRARALDELDSLVEKGLVQVEGSGSRYALLVTIREFAAECLEKEGEADRVRQAHADHFVKMCREVHDGITGTTQLDAMRRARADNTNVFLALQWLTERARTGDARALEQALLIAGCQNWVWHINGQHLTARAAVDDILALAQHSAPSLGRSLARATAGMVSISTGEMSRGLEEWQGSWDDALAIGEDAARGQAGVGLGFTHVVDGRLDAARVILEQTAELTERTGADFMHAVALEFLGTVHGVSGDLDNGIAIVGKGVEIAVRIDDYEARGVGTSFLAQLHFMKGDVERALEYYRDALVALETVGDRPEIARVHGEMGWAALSVGRIVEARRSFLNSLRWYDEVGSARGVGTALTGLAVAEDSDGNPDRAAMIAAAADVMADQAGVVVVHAMGIGAGDQIEALRRTFEPKRLALLTEAGRAMSPAEITAMIEPRPAASTAH